MRALSKWKNSLPDGATMLVTAGIVVLFVLLLAGTLAGFVLYRIVSPAQLGAELSVNNLLGNPTAVVYSGPGGGEREGWFFPGLRNAPVIILAPGYRSHRGELLTLATSLQENQYNVFMIDLPGHGKSEGFSWLGFAEAGELRAAVDAVAARDDVDRSRIGVWGTNISAYAAVVVAAGDERVRAVAMDSVFDSPLDMLRMESADSGLGNLPVVRSMLRWLFLLFNFSHRNDETLAQLLPRMDKTAKLFIESVNVPELATSTRDLFGAAAQPKQHAVFVKTTYAAMPPDTKREYDSAVVSFFLQHVNPLARPPARPR